MENGEIIRRIEMSISLLHNINIIREKRLINVVAIMYCQHMMVLICMNINLTTIIKDYIYCDLLLSKAQIASSI